MDNGEPRRHKDGQVGLFSFMLPDRRLSYPRHLVHDRYARPPAATTSRPQTPSCRTTSSSPASTRRPYQPGTLFTTVRATPLGAQRRVRRSGASPATAHRYVPRGPRVAKPAAAQTAPASWSARTIHLRVWPVGGAAFAPPVPSCWRTVRENLDTYLRAGAHRPGRSRRDDPMRRLGTPRRPRPTSSTRCTPSAGLQLDLYLEPPSTAASVTCTW